MGPTDYVEIPLHELVELESGPIYRPGPSSPKKPLPPHQTSSFARIMGSKREHPAKSSPFPIKRMISNAELGLKSLRFLDKNSSREGEGWRAVERRFEQFAVAGVLHKENFGRCIGMADSKEFAVELYEALARRRGLDPEKGVSKDGLQEFWEEMTDQNFDSRLRIFFDMCDKNGDGKLTEDEVKEVIILSASANKLAKLKGHASTYAALIMEDLDPDQLGLLRGLVNSEGQSEKMMKRSQTLLKTMIPRRYRNPVENFANKSMKFVHENWKRIWVLGFWLALNISVFGWKFYQYRTKAAFEVMGYCVCVAKGSAETLKLNMALILLPVCRNTITRLRSTALHYIFPFDDNINFHKVGCILHFVDEFPEYCNAKNSCKKTKEYSAFSCFSSGIVIWSSIGSSEVLDLKQRDSSVDWHGGGGMSRRAEGGGGMRQRRNAAAMESGGD